VYVDCITVVLLFLLIIVSTLFTLFICSLQSDRVAYLLLVACTYCTLVVCIMTNSIVVLVIGLELSSVLLLLTVVLYGNNVERMHACSYAIVYITLSSIPLIALTLHDRYVLSVITVTGMDSTTISDSTLYVALTVFVLKLPVYCCHA
jgi:formate hydrogenlyase subunit 3/multisubunit Na+/H+ antiporter MnhD subunit